MYEIIFARKSLKKLKKLPKASQERIISSLERIRIRPEKYVKKLIGETAYRLRVGEYRIILDIKRKQILILVLDVGLRKNICKKL